MQTTLRDDQTGQFQSVYTEEQDEFLREVYPVKGPKTFKFFNKRFGTNKTKAGIYSRAKYIGIHWNGRCRWDEKQIEYLKEIYPNRSISETTKMINEKFGTTHSVTAVQTKANRVGVKTGYCPQNFQKGKANPYLDSAPIGTITLWTKYKGKKYPLIKVDDKVGVDRRKNWKFYKNYVWEQHNGKIPEDCFIAVADGNEENCNIDNLRCVPFKYIQTLCNHNHWLGKGKEISDAGIAWCDLHYALIDKEENNG